MAKLKYYDTAERKKRPAFSLKAIHTEFLRTGRINRRQEDWIPDERRYLTHEEVAERTGKKLETAGENTYQRINSYHNAIRFPKMVFHRTLADSPHLGYCHVTAAHSNFSRFEDVTWSFYIANFFSEIGTSDAFFEHINVGFARMYFAVAMAPSQESGKMAINRKVRGNGLLFRTHDPKLALKNVLLLGAGHEELRKIIRAI